MCVWGGVRVCVHVHVHVCVHVYVHVYVLFLSLLLSEQVCARKGAKGAYCI